jgi:2-polyprenyl-6-methoxyphenol hydroxylase-like FAD-dependent oxidoreductase
MMSDDMAMDGRPATGRVGSPPGQRERADDVAVLIVGAGPVGLCGALQLARFGVRILLVERQPGTSIQPKARGLNIRTMELLRTWGLEDQVRAASVTFAGPTRFLWVESLAGRELRGNEPAVGTDAAPAVLAAISPTTGCACTQDDLEQILLAAVRRCPPSWRTCSRGGPRHARRHTAGCDKYCSSGP